MDRFRFALRPKWIFGHVLVTALLVTFVSCGLWQIRRLDQRKSFNALVTANQSQPVVDVDRLGLRTDQGTGHAKHLQGRNVRVTGTYLADRSVVIRGQSIDSRPGVWIVTPIRTGDGDLVLVNRGFVMDNGGLNAPPPNTRPPSGTVTVLGSVQPTETPAAFETRDGTARTTAYQRIDIDRIRGALGAPTLPLWVLATSQHPADPDTTLTPVPPPVLTDGPHLSYTIQWFGFTLVGLIGYPLLLRRKASDLERGPADDEIIDETESAVEVPDASSASDENDEALTTSP